MTRKIINTLFLFGVVTLKTMFLHQHAQSYFCIIAVYVLTICLIRMRKVPFSITCQHAKPSLCHLWPAHKGLHPAQLILTHKFSYEIYLVGLGNDWFHWMQKSRKSYSMCVTLDSTSTSMPLATFSLCTLCCPTSSVQVI